MMWGFWHRGGGNHPEKQVERPVRVRSISKKLGWPFRRWQKELSTSRAATRTGWCGGMRDRMSRRPRRSVSDRGRWPTGAQVQNYLEQYAHAFHVAERLRLDTDVVRGTSDSA